MAAAAGCPRRIPAQIAGITATQAEIAQLAEQEADKAVLFAAGGPSYAAALFGAAKVKECSPDHAISIPLEEFHHYNSQKRGDPLFLIAPSGPSVPRARDTAEEGRRWGGTIYAVVTGEESMLDACAHKILRLPSVPEVLRRWSIRSRCSSSPTTAMAFRPPSGPRHDDGAQAGLSWYFTLDDAFADGSERPGCTGGDAYATAARPEPDGARRASGQRSASAHPRETASRSHPCRPDSAICRHCTTGGVRRRRRNGRCSRARTTSTYCPPSGGYSAFLQCRRFPILAMTLGAQRDPPRPCARAAPRSHSIRRRLHLWK